MLPLPERPWTRTTPDQCYFYHTMHYPDGEVREGTWTISDFPQYIGNYPLAGKTVLEIGTASGFLAFNAEKAGAQVTALDAKSSREFKQVPFASAQSFKDVAAWRQMFDDANLKPIKNSWWYSWHKFKSQAEVFYSPIEDLYECDRLFDVVIAGAIIEHLADPVTAIGAWAHVAKEAVLIPFTDVVETDQVMMRPMTEWTNPAFAYAWWQLSRGLFVRLFDNLGFDVEFASSTARHNDDPSGPLDATRPTIIARRRNLAAG